ncbi:MAG: hypothetical protein QM647_18650 [Asticcacaulis sp.]|uniref:M61 family metallopeptidase n=1 Tax=Asticcacaulis sp. TaxID=1872648 RepID=UPI0039E5A76B
MNRKRVWTFGVAAFSIINFGAGALIAQTLTEPRLSMTWKPLAENGEVAAIAVSETIDGAKLEAGERLSFSAPVVYAAVTGVADRITDLKVSDVDGGVDLIIDEDKAAPGGMPYYRHWRARRAVKWPVTVTYKALVQPVGSPNGPAFGIRPSGGGVSGSGGGFLLLPENAGTTKTRVEWDLSALPAGSIGVTTFGEGAFNVAGAPDAVTEGWLMAGPAQHLELKDNSHFKAYWLGTPPFDAKAEMDWAARGYALLSQSYKYLDPAPDYRVFLRALDTPPYGGGTALGNSFMFSMAAGKPRDVLDTRVTLFHEMGHQWVGQMEGGINSNWFNEGLNVYYTTVLPMRGGLMSVTDYGNLLNQQAKDYYTSPARNWSADKIAEVGFGSEQIRHTPYMRGQLYFADLDVKIRKHPHGKHTLDSFLAPMFVEREKGRKVDQAWWEDRLRDELGPQAVSEFRAINVDGSQTIDPASGAWGPCFERKATSFKTDIGSVTGYQWIRRKAIPDTACHN